MNVPSRFRSSPPPPQTQQPQQVQLHPEAAEFLNHAVELRRVSGEQARIIERLRSEIDTLQQRLAVTDEALTRKTIECEKFASGYFELKAHLSIVVTTAIASAKQVADVATSAIEQTNVTLLRAGLTPERTPEQQQQVDDGVAELARKLAPDQEAA